MGGCYSAPSSSGANFWRSRKLRCLPSISCDYDDDDEDDNSVNDDPLSHPSSGTASPVSVLRGPQSSAAEFLRRFLLGAELGRGEFGVTRRCSDATTGETLACKSISKRKLRTIIDVSDVRREIEIMRRLPEHPNIVRLREAYEDGEAVHLVMEICEGGELFDRIVARGHYTERAAATIFKTIVEVVQVWH